MLWKPKTDPGLIRRLDELERRLGNHERAVKALGDSVDEMAKPIRDIEMEWEDWFEKFRNLYARISRRQQREAKESEVEQPAGDAHGLPPDANPAALKLLGRSA